MKELPKIIVTDIGEYIEKGSCERNLKLRLDKEDVVRRFPFYPMVRRPLNPVLAMNGRRLEDQWASDFSRRMVQIGPRAGKETEMTWTDLLEGLAGLHPGECAFAREVGISRQIGAYEVSGRMDYVLLRWNAGTPVLRIVECKASRKDKTYHRIQLAAYRIMVEEAMAEADLTVAGAARKDVRLESVVARIDEATNWNQDALRLPSLDLREEMDDLRQLLAPGGPVQRVSQSPLESLSYRLDPKCETCKYCMICLPESARLRRSELIGADPSIIKALRRHGVLDIDSLADLDPGSEQARSLRASPGFNADLNDLIVRAKARRSTLTFDREGDWGVMARPNPGLGQLPRHQYEGSPRLVRVYLNVEYDYIENRLVGLSAHVTDSGTQLITRSESGEARPRPDPVPVEAGEEPGKYQALNCREVAALVPEAWTGFLTLDDEKERRMVQGFFVQLANAIIEVSGEDAFRPVHFYVWSRSDIIRLVESCVRSGGPLLHSLTELLGCREGCQGPLEQLIYTPLNEEIAQKVALGYTGSSLAVATSLTWFRFPRFHWTRSVDGAPVDLSYQFRRDVFDFRSSLTLDGRREWCGRRDPEAHAEFFEVRSKFGSDINVPYWYAMWGTLPAGAKDGLERTMLDDYRRGGSAPLIRTLMIAKCQALRYLEERLSKNYGIAKPLMPVKDLRQIEQQFAARYDLVNACLDFMRLDHHIRKVEWVTSCMRSPANRVAEGLSLPLRDLTDLVMDDGSHVLRGTVDLERFSLDPDVFFSASIIGEDSFVRITPYSGDPEKGQSVGDVLGRGVTCKVTYLDAKTGLFAARLIPSNYKDPIARGYVLPSLPCNANMPFALVEEGVSAYVQNRVDEWLRNNRGAPAVRWFDPTAPSIPERPGPSDAALTKWGAVLRSMKVLDRNLDEVQVQACLDGLGSTVQLLLGPPGTGKTNTTASAILLRLAASPAPKLFLLSANTHTAVDELTERLRLALPSFRQASAENDADGRVVSILRLKDGPSNEEEIAAEDVSHVRDLLRQNHVIISGTVNEMLRFGRSMERSGWPGGARASGLIVDEASMMVFPDFLALATMLSATGEIMLAGDHMQLSPITAQDWASETREQMVRLAPQDSAYLAMKRLCGKCNERALGQSELTVTYRLTPELIGLIAEVYRAEGVDLVSRKGAEAKDGKVHSLSDIWKFGGVFLVEHDESDSRKCNVFEAELVRDIIAARPGPEKDIRPGSVSIITPHRAQRGILKELLMARYGTQIKMIDTVERLQGGECETVIVSGTQSDMNAIGDSAEFILNLNRTNVIFSRAKERLVVVCSKNLLDSVPADIDDYRSSWLWKRLRSMCDTEVLQFQKNGHKVSVRVPGDFWKTN